MHFKRRGHLRMKKRSLMLPFITVSLFSVFCSKSKPTEVQLPYDVQVESVIGLSNQDKKDIIDLGADLSDLKIQKIVTRECVQLTDCMTGHVEFVPETLQNAQVIHRSFYFSNTQWNWNGNYSDTSIFQQGNWITSKNALIIVTKNILDLDSCRIEVQIPDSIPVNDIVVFLNKVNGKQFYRQSSGVVADTLSTTIPSCRMDFIYWDVSVNPNRVFVGYDTSGGISMSYIFDYDGGIPQYIALQESIP
jgi:hypothetical protein